MDTRLVKKSILILLVLSLSLSLSLSAHAQFNFAGESRTVAGDNLPEALRDATVTRAGAPVGNLNFGALYGCSSLDNTVMKLSNPLGGGHGAVHTESSYDRGVCFTYTGSEQNVHACNGNNLILKLSGSTNAHAQGPDQTGYSTSICHAGYENCRTLDSNFCGDTEVAVVKLSGDTNAHVAAGSISNPFGSATKTVCCTVVANAGEPEVPDTDGDGIPDDEDPDDDNDGVDDGDDDCPLVPGPVANNGCPDADDDGDDDGDQEPDNDGDGIPDEEDDDDDNDGIDDEDDNCPLVHNPGQEDTGGSPQGDACEDDNDGDGIDDDQDPDDDNDGIDDEDDNCPLISNNSQTDTDGDGQGDACEDDNDGDGIPDDEDPDDDNDGIPDGDGDNPCTGGATENCDDNCPTVSNPAQTDSDNDGVGDACEGDNDGDGIDDNDDPDDDNDGIDDEDDNCDFDNNPSQTDTDNDGVGDACDSCPGTAEDANVDSRGCAEGQDPTDLITCGSVGGISCSGSGQCTTEKIASGTNELYCCLDEDVGEDTNANGQSGETAGCAVDVTPAVLGTPISIVRERCNDPDGDGQGTKTISIFNQGTSTTASLPPELSMSDIVPECPPGASNPCQAPCTTLPAGGEQQIVPFYTVMGALLSMILIISFYVFKRRKQKY